MKSICLQIQKSAGALLLSLALLTSNLSFASVEFGAVAFMHSETVSTFFLGSGNPQYPYQGGPVYDDYTQSMNTVFGVGGWDDVSYEAADPLQMFSPAYRLIYMEGSENDAIAFNNFVQANLPLIEAWVFNGGVLMMNASPTTGGNINMGFGGVGIVYPAISVVGIAQDPGHPIFTGPNLPAFPVNGGFFYGHAVVCPPGMTSLINSIGGAGFNPILMESEWGDGLVLFGGLQPSGFHAPQPDVFNVKLNTLEYMDAASTLSNNIVGDDFVCQGGIETYSVSPAVGDVYVWSVTSGGSFVNGNVGPSVDIQWANTPTNETVTVVVQTPGATTSSALDFDTQCLDLETSGVSLAPCGIGSDVLFVDNVVPSPNSTIDLQNGAQWAMLTGASFDDVTRCDVDNAVFSAVNPVTPFANGEVWLILTGDGNYFKLGNAVESATNVTFDFAQLSASCGGGESCTLDITIEDDINLACNDKVHISMDENCRAVLEADMLLEGEGIYPNSSFEVRVFEADGSLIPNATLTQDHVGQMLEYRVTQTCTGNTCWGRLIAEDKLIPNLECRDTVIVAQCGESTDPEVVGFPLPMGFNAVRVPGQNEYVVSGFDPCGDVWLRFSDEIVKNGCGAQYYTMITRTWNVEDASGNSTSCVEQIGVEPGDFANITFPPNYDGFGKFALECDFRDIVRKSQPVGGVNIGWNSLANGHPSPYDKVLNANDTLIGTGYPEGATCEHLAVSYRDRIIETCGKNTYKLFRTWKVYDWCTGEDSIHIQAIKVVDTRAPELVCPTSAPVIVPTTPWTCTGSYIVPDPIFDPNFSGVATVPVILRECNDWTYEVRHKISSEGTMSPDDCADVDESETFFTTNVRQLPNGDWEVFDMPQGCNWIKYIITDDCGNSVECGLEVFVADEENPVAVCDEHTVISLNENGDAQLCAEVVDNGSQDNCTPSDELTYLIKKMGEDDSKFRDCIDFSCKDVAISPIMVVFRVFDKAGNYNDCMVEVTVQDKIAPNIVCPDDIEISCTLDYLDDNVTGLPDVSDQCGLGRLTSSIVEEDLNDCGIGYVIKRWRIEDNGGRFDICDQRIDIVDYDLFDGSDIIWPRDYTVDGCKVIDAHPNNLPNGFGWPDYRNEDCAKPASGFEDEVFYNVPGYCIKIIRTWEVIDWCQYDTQTGLGGKWTKVQTIYIENNDAPEVIGGCEDQTVCADEDCDGLVEFELEGNDDCTPSDELEWSYEVRDISTGDVVDSGLGNTYSEELPRGTYRFTWTVKDGCANEGTCTSDVHIRDCKEPTPYCKPGIVTTIMPSTGYVEIWASDFNDASFDNCTDTMDLRYSFSDDVDDQFRKIFCDDIEGGVVDTFTYEMWVTDLDGNQDFCTVTIIVQDNQNRCPDSGNITAAVGGLITTADNANIAAVTVDLMHSNVFAKGMETADDGNFAFYDLTMKEDYSVIPHKNDDHLNGVSTADIVLIQRHLLGKQDIDSPYKLIAADANNSESVSAADIAELRKLILGVFSELPKNSSWRFIDAQYSFGEPTDPWLDPIKEVILYNEIEKDEMATNFVGVKIGDVNGDADVNGLGGNSTRSGEVVTLITSEEVFAAGHDVSVNITTEEAVSIYGMQMTIELSDIENVSIASGSMEITEGQYFVNERTGVLTLTWSVDEIRTFEEGEVLFTITGTTIDVVTTSQMLKVSSSVTKAEAYLEDLEVAGLTIDFGKKSGEAPSIALHQNIPNPFSGSTVIPFELPADASATMTIFDVTGKVQLVVFIEGRAGYNEFELSTDKLSKGGVLYYQLESNQEVATKRMLMID